MAIHLKEHGILITGYEAESKDGSSSKYESDVADVVAEVAKSKTGQAVIHKVEAHGTAVFKPFIASRATEKGRCNAVTGAVQSDSKLGKISTIEYSVHTWQARSNCKGPGTQADVVLLHELLHAGRRLGGDWSHSPLSGELAKYTSAEEFFAVMVENIFVSETGRQTDYAAGGWHTSNLRGNHDSPRTHIQAPLTESILFLVYPPHFPLIKEFCENHTEVGPMLAKAPARFNPVRDYFQYFD